MSNFDNYERVLCFNNDRVIVIQEKELTRIENASNHSISWIMGKDLIKLGTHMDYIYKGDTLYTDGNNVYTKSGNKFDFIKYESCLHDKESNLYENNNSYVRLLDDNGEIYANLMILYVDAEIDARYGSDKLSIKKFHAWNLMSKQKPLPIFGCDKYDEDCNYVGQNAGVDLDTGESFFLSCRNLSNMKHFDETNYDNYGRWYNKFYLSHSEASNDNSRMDWCRWNRLLLAQKGIVLSPVERTTGDEYFINLSEWPLEFKNGDFVPAYNFGVGVVDIHFGFKGLPCMLQIVSTDLNGLGIILKDKYGNVYSAFNKDSKVKPGTYKLQGIV